MRCSYCYSPPRAGEGMSIETAFRALELGAELGSPRCGIVFFGGEPLLHRELIAAVVERGRELNRQGGPAFHFKLTTNGLALDRSFLDYATANDVLVAMSFDGVRAAHDAHRRLPDGSPSFEPLLARLDELLAARPYSSVLSVVSPDHARYLADSVTFLLERGCRYLILSLDYAAPWQQAELEVLEQQYQRLGELYLQWTRAGRKFYLSPFEVKIASHVKGCRFGEDRCELGERQISVDPQGYLYPCVQFTRAGPGSEWCIGHVGTGLDLAARQRIREGAARVQEPCQSCAVRLRCHHTCGCLNWQTTGTTDAVSPVLCRHEQMLLPIADRVAATLYRERSPLFLHKHYNAAYPVLSLIEDGLEG
jgi:uncharacterized protein